MRPTLSPRSRRYDKDPSVEERPERRARAESVGGIGKEIKERAAAGEPRKGHGSRRGEGRRRPRGAAADQGWKGKREQGE